MESNHSPCQGCPACVCGLLAQGIEVNGQLGFFAEWLEGTYAEKMTIHAKTAWMSRIPVEWVGPLPCNASRLLCPSLCSSHGMPACHHAHSLLRLHISHDAPA